MMKFFKWWADNRPKILTRFWLVLAFINMADALFLTWAGREYPDIDVTSAVWFSGIMAFISLGMFYLWRYYVENPEEYEKLQKRGLRRTRRDSKDEDEKK